jgi:hypothetical protein
MRSYALLPRLAFQCVRIGADCFGALSTFVRLPLFSAFSTFTVKQRQHKPSPHTKFGSAVSA